MPDKLGLPNTGRLPAVMPPELQSVVHIPRLLRGIPLSRPSQNLGSIFHSQVNVPNLFDGVRTSYPIPWVSVRRNPIAAITPLSTGNPVSRLATSGPLLVSAMNSNRRRAISNLAIRVRGAIKTR